MSYVLFLLLLMDIETFLGGFALLERVAVACSFSHCSLAVFGAGEEMTSCASGDEGRRDETRGRHEITD
jgi:hypothetical protein